MLSNLFVLSAAHCFTLFESADALAGIHNIIKDVPAYEHEIFPSDVIIHALYNGVSHLNDIAIVRLDRNPIVFSASIQPLTLAPRSMASTNLTNAVGRVAGW